MINRDNYQLVKRYLVDLRDVMQVNPVSIERYRAYLRHPLVWADYLPFSQATTIRPTFGVYLATARERGALAPMTIKKILQTTKRFFLWVKANHPREFHSVPTSWIETLRWPRWVDTPKEHQFITLEQVLQLVTLEIDASDLATRRDQAAAAMLFLSGIRAGALGSLTLACVDLANRTIKQ